MAIYRKEERRVRQRCTHAYAHAHAPRSGRIQRKVVGKASGRERKGLPSFDPIPISASRSVPSYRPAIAISPADTHPPLNPVLRRNLRRSSAHARLFGPGADAPRSSGSHCLHTSVYAPILSPIGRLLSDCRSGCPFLGDNAIALDSPRRLKRLVETSGARLLFSFIKAEYLLPVKSARAKRERPGTVDSHRDFTPRP